MVTAPSQFMKKGSGGVGEFRYLRLMSERKERCLLRPLRQKMDEKVPTQGGITPERFLVNIQTFS